MHKLVMLSAAILWLGASMDFGVLDSEGRILKIVGFFGPFSPMDR